MEGFIHTNLAREWKSSFDFVIFISQSSITHIIFSFPENKTTVEIIWIKARHNYSKFGVDTRSLFCFNQQVTWAKWTPINSIWSKECYFELHVFIYRGIQKIALWNSVACSNLTNRNTPRYRTYLNFVIRDSDKVIY